MLWGNLSDNVPRRVEVPAALLHSYGFGIRDLPLVNETAVPDGLENGIVEAEYHDVLHRLFAQIVIDAIDLIFLQHILDVAVQRLGRLQIVSKRLFDYHPAPVSILLTRKSGCSQLTHNLRKKLGRRCQIEKIVALRMVPAGARAV